MGYWQAGEAIHNNKCASLKAMRDFAVAGAYQVPLFGGFGHMNRVVMSGELRYERINEFLSEVTNKHSEILKAGELIIDFTNLEIIDPLSIVVLINLCRQLRMKLGIRIILNVPENLFPLGEFEKGEEKELNGCIGINPTPKNKSNYSIKILHLKSEQCTGSYLKEINLNVQDWASNGGASERQIFYATNFIAEMLYNVYKHSMSEYCRLVLQLLKLDQDRTRLVLAIGDDGIGIRESLLSRNCNWHWKGSWKDNTNAYADNSDGGINLITIRDDVTSIKFVLNMGISRWKAEKRGSGLSGFGTLSREKDADFIIHSGTSLYGIIDKNARELTNNLKHHLSGTSVCLILHPM